MASYDSCLERVLQLLAPLGKDGHAVTQTSDLAGDLGLSSIDIMEVIEQVEDTFDISFPLNSLSDIRSVADLVKEIARLSAA